MLTRRGAVIGMAAVASIAAVDVGVFLYTGGWATPSALTPSRFEQVYGHHDGIVAGST
jgi:catalase